MSILQEHLNKFVADFGGAWIRILVFKLVIEGNSVQRELNLGVNFEGIRSSYDSGP